MSTAPRPVPTPLGSQACDVAVRAAEDAAATLPPTADCDTDTADGKNKVDADLLDQRVSLLEHAETKVSEALGRCQEESRHG